MTTLLSKNLHRFAALAMLGVVFSFALLTSPLAGATPATARMVVSAASDSATQQATQHPLKQHSVNDCVLCKNQILIGSASSDQPRMDAFVASVPPLPLLPAAARARAPPVLEHHVESPALGFNPRGPPSVS